MVQIPSAQIPGVYHRRIGDIVVTALSDGYLDGTVEVMQNIAPADAERMLTDRFRPGRRTSVNCYLVYSAGRLALIETGSGNYLLPTAGKLQENLKAAGVNPADIEAVILTHMHPDHSAGLTNMATGERYFPNAELIVHENEPKHWGDDGAMSRADERARKLYFQAAREQMAPYHNQMRPFNKSVEVFPGVTSIPMHGHTPGHSGYMIQSGGKSLLIWGDIIHVPEVQVPRPEVTMAFDTDPHAAAATRRRVFDMVATDRQLIAGMHVHFPGFAHLVRQGENYLMVPEPWDQAFGA
ncbi:MBL fold metallo-hydrolase [Rhodopila sp.]|jgi:glyoxylase-like metal-dependent hydrolase (beta-lactamase superfamily II)|uniref:MBL fold metallo-hydrolase n=1 Tax=Rhodopila sp. TaxID=2480087 RepID=UPI002D047FE2|nr:MBL fold metallo-hydrolase [Rhodopila sp.]HVZ07805.1 MBL fold metallo-hydrolase [Rhodopila sp.]